MNMGRVWSRAIHEGWRGQYDRMKRWHARMRATLTGDAHEPDAETEYDLIYAFFQNCYHMRDWLINSEAAVPEEEVKAFIGRHTELQICADICNGTKHYRQRRPRIDDRFLIGREYVAGNIADTEPPGVNFFVMAAGERFDLLDLASRCIQLWEDLLRERRLL